MQRYSTGAAGVSTRSYPRSRGIRPAHDRCEGVEEVGLLCQTCPWPQPVRTLHLDHHTIVDEVCAGLAARLVHTAHRRRIRHVPADQVKDDARRQHRVRGIGLQVTSALPTTHPPYGPGRAECSHGSFAAAAIRPASRRSDGGWCPRTVQIRCSARYARRTRDRNTWRCDPAATTDPGDPSSTTHAEWPALESRHERACDQGQRGGDAARSA